MKLREVRIQNFRSLEDVRIVGLQDFNVFIGRNNAGKSSVFDALRHLRDCISGQVNFPETILAEPNKPLRYELTFALTGNERQQCVDALFSEDSHHDRRKRLMESPAFSEVVYSFKAATGKIWPLQLEATEILAEDGKRVAIQRLQKTGANAHQSHRFTLIATIANDPAGMQMVAGILDVDAPTSANREDLAYDANVTIPGNMPDPAVNLIQRMGKEYFIRTFFFFPFRQSGGQGPAVETVTLDQDGGNLAQRLHTLRSNSSLFDHIEEFIHGALPDLGRLRSPLTSAQTRIAFGAGTEGLLIDLKQMGSGIEQLLMIATALLTTDDESPLFLEEPEGHLHAGAQRYLVDRLTTGKRQVFITTHSPVFLGSPKPHSAYQVSRANGRTSIECLEPSGLADALADIGVRNSDVLLSDAVLFVEGPSDGEVISVWCRTLGQSLESRNIAVIPMGGGAEAARHAPMRSDVLKGISEKARFPHLFLLDRDERSDEEIAKMEKDLGDHLCFLPGRELENSLLSSDAILRALNYKFANQPEALKKFDEATTEVMDSWIRNAIEETRPAVVIKRIRSSLPRFTGGFFPRELVTELLPFAESGDLPSRLRQAFEQRFHDHINGMPLDDIVQSARASIEQDWGDSLKRQQLAPGADVLDSVYQKVGGSYDKRKDGRRIAECMTADEIPAEIKALVKRIGELVRVSS